MNRATFLLGCVLIIGAFAGGQSLAAPPGVALFTEDGPVAAGWRVTDWSDLRKTAPEGAAWRVEQGVLHGSTPRGTWLMSEAEYGDFFLEFEWKLGERGNSGVALRAPMHGDPAFDGLELQMVDPRYFPDDQKPQASELTGSLYRARAPSVQVFRPGEWNRYQIFCRGPHVQVLLNGTTIQELQLDKEIAHPLRHDGSKAPSLAERPKRGHIGFQELSRGGGHVEIRRVRIEVMQ